MRVFLECYDCEAHLGYVDTNWIDWHEDVEKKVSVHLAEGHVVP